MNPNCIYIHPNLPPKSQLKWSSQSQATIDQIKSETGDKKPDDVNKPISETTANQLSNNNTTNGANSIIVS